ncbi:glycosyl hydrolase [Spirochaetia bacterium]|nr:glycosyl hydrolase [Spirochaetia bacterium]
MGKNEILSDEMCSPVREILLQATPEEKAALWSGKSFWQTRGIERLSLPPVVVSDGPHGLRRQKEEPGKSDNLGVNSSDPAVCYPAASLSACSFDPELLEEMGRALGEECRKSNVDVLLGPGVNHKRSPLCGRNFEYFSEDPLLSAAMGGAWVRGVQSMGVGACLKHFALNSQEDARFFNSSDIDTRTMREIYLPAFEHIIRECQPWSVMPSYNRINEVYSCENPALLGELGRKTFGFKGAYISDWGAVPDMIASVKAGLNLEMPSSHGAAIKRILTALKNGSLNEKELNDAIEKVIELSLKVREGKKIPFEFNEEKSLALAKKIAAESAVLLKNEDAALPLKRSHSITVIGAFAANPRYQGAGSSKINPVKLDNTREALANLGFNFDYAEGYDAVTGQASEDQIRAAVEAAKGKDRVVIFAGLPASYESEGYDRPHINLPEGHNRIISEAAKINPNVVVVLQTGSAAAMPWIDSVRAVLLVYLSGCQGGAAAADLLTGIANPCGHLAETFPKKIEDTPCHNFYHKDKFNSLYAEGIYTGYRYYSTAGIKPLFPFGHGLSYTSFEYSDLTLSAGEISARGKEIAPLVVTVTIANSGPVSGKVAVQLYVSQKNPSVFKAARELKAFQKISLAAGEKKTCTFTLDGTAFTHFNAALNDFDIASGDYEIQIGASSEDIKSRAPLQIKNSIPSEDIDYAKILPSYYAPKNNNFNEQEYRKLLPAVQKKKFTHPFTADTPVFALGATAIGSIIKKAVIKQGRAYNKENPDSQLDEFLNMPIRFFAQSNLGITRDTVDGIAAIANGRFIKGIKFFLSGEKF